MNFKENKLLIIINIISLLTFILLAILVYYHKTEPFDNSIYGFISIFISPSFTNVAKIISELGNVICIVMICLTIVIIPKVRWIGIPASITVSISAILNSILKKIFRRSRPNIFRLVEETSFSFPSGHSMNNMALYFFIALTLLFYLKNKRIKYSTCVAFFLYVLFVGLSRIYLGVHYASDVLAGFAIGIWVSITCFLFINPHNMESQR